VVMLIVWRSSVDVVFFIEETPPLKVPDFSRRGRAGDCIPRKRGKLVPFEIDWLVHIPREIVVLRIKFTDGVFFSGSSV